MNSIERCGGGGEWYFVTDGDWVEGGDMSESTARAIAGRLNEQAEEIERLRDRIKQHEAGMDSAGLSWMRSCDELTAECFRHKAEIERLRNRIEELKGHLTWIGWSEDGVIRAKAEIERLRKSDADKHQLYKIACDELERRMSG